MWQLLPRVVCSGTGRCSASKRRSPLPQNPHWNRRVGPRQHAGLCTSRPSPCLPLKRRGRMNHPPLR